MNSANVAGATPDKQLQMEPRSCVVPAFVWPPAMRNLGLNFGQSYFMDGIQWYNIDLIKLPIVFH